MAVTFAVGSNRRIQVGAFKTMVPRPTSPVALSVSAALRSAVDRRSATRAGRVGGHVGGGQGADCRVGHCRWARTQQGEHHGKQGRCFYSFSNARRHKFPAVLLRSTNFVKAGCAVRGRILIMIKNHSSRSMTDGRSGTTRAITDSMSGGIRTRGLVPPGQAAAFALRILRLHRSNFPALRAPPGQGDPGPMAAGSMRGILPLILAGECARSVPFEADSTGREVNAP